MKSTVKKIAASLLALLIMIQMVPALAATYSSGMIVGSAEGYKEALAIVASKGTYVLLGQTLVLDVNEDYEPAWETSNAGAATIDENGIVTAIAEGTATMTATVNSPTRMTASIEVTVIDPGVVLAEDEEEGKKDEEGTEEDEDGEKQTKVSAENMLVIVINGENEHVTYDGEEHLLNRYVATANDEELFDESKIKVEGEIGVTATDCGIYEMALDGEGITFTYDDEEVEAHFVINNGFLKITPAAVTVTANDIYKEEGTDDPELTATVEGLFGEDTIEYTLSRTEGEEIGDYEITATGEEQQGNYRIEYIPGKLSITGEPVVSIEVSIPEGQAVYYGTEITLIAVPAGFGDVELSYQWQYSIDGQEWYNLENGNKKIYTYELTEENIGYEYRVSVDTIK